jgi:hypothetical protein
MSDPPGADFKRDITPGEQPWLYRVRYRALARAGAVVSAAPRSEAVLAGTKSAEPAQKMNGTSILVERLYTG